MKKLIFSLIPLLFLTAIANAQWTLSRTNIPSQTISGQATIFGTMTVIAPVSLQAHNNQYVVSVTSTNKTIVAGITGKGEVKAVLLTVSGATVLAGSTTARADINANGYMVLAGTGTFDNIQVSSAGTHTHIDSLEARADNFDISSATMNTDLNYCLDKTADMLVSSANIHLSKLDKAGGTMTGQINGTLITLTSSITASMSRQFAITISTPLVGTIVTKVYKDSWTLEEVCAYAGVPPAGANMTITVTTVTANSTNAGWLSGTSLGTLTIANGKIQSNTITSTQYIAKDTGGIRFEVTAIGSTANNTGYDVCITGKTKW